MADNPLDNLAWHALTGSQAAFALGHGMARYYPRDLAPFGAIAWRQPLGRCER